MDKHNETLLNIDFAKNLNSSSKLFYQLENSWKELSFQQLIKYAENFANLLTNSNLERGSRLALICESRPEWGVVFFGSVYAGQTLVPLDPKLTLSELSSILKSCRPNVLCFSSKYQKTALELKKQITSLKFLIEVDLFEREKEKEKEKEENKSNKIIYLKKRLEESPTFLSKPKQEEVLLIVYTSGTTGKPKGVMLTYRNLSFEFEAIFSVIKLRKERFLSVLPMNHMLELMAGFLYPLHTDSNIYYLQNFHSREMLKTIKEQKISCMIVVPIFLNLFKKNIRRELNSLSKLKKKLFCYLEKLAPFLPNLLRRIVFFPVHNSIGASLKNFVSGGASLSEDLELFLSNLGFGVYQGYGLTETSPVISVNTKKNRAFGSVGQALPGVELKIEATGEKVEGKTQEEELTRKEANEANFGGSIGEILVRGDNVMAGYYCDPEATSEVLDSEGWLRTGDLGEIRRDFLYIRGRLKNTIVLPGGKKVQPEEVEAVLSESDLFQEVCVLGISSDKQNKLEEEVSAVVIPSEALLELSPEEAKKQINIEINLLASKSLASYKRPTSIFTFPGKSLPKTSTKKFKRAEILRSLFSEKSL